VWVDLSDAMPPELGKRRPAVIVSSSLHNQLLESVVVVPLSSRAPEILPLRVKVRPSGLAGSSFAVVPGIRQVKKSRILGPAGTLSTAAMATLDRAVADYLAD
jgi:mRNA-degrading endonuclease toxin of MazEF toxin-antitoxin module